jgi:hypothetical protein
VVLFGSLTFSTQITPQQAVGLSAIRGIKSLIYYIRHIAAMSRWVIMEAGLPKRKPRNAEIFLEWKKHRVT